MQYRDNTRSLKKFCNQSAFVNRVAISTKLLSVIVFTVIPTMCK